MIVYRYGGLDTAGSDTPYSFTLSPFTGKLFADKSSRGLSSVSPKDFQAYEVNKKDILFNAEGVSPNYLKKGTADERELLIFPENVKPINVNFSKGGRIEKNPYGTNYQRMI